MTPEPLSNLPIEELLRRAQEGDRDAWEILISRYRNTLRDRAKLKVSPRTPGGILASDVAQEATLKAWKSFQSLSQLKGTSQGQLEGWLHTILDSSLVDLVRKAEADKRNDSGMLPLDSSEAVNVPASQPSPSQFSAQRESFRELLMHFSELPDDQREALSLLHFERLPLNEVANRLERSERAAESLLRRAVRTLRDRMEGFSNEMADPSAAASHVRMDAALSLYFRVRETDASFELETFLLDYPDCAPELRSLLGWLEKLRALKPSGGKE